MNPATNEAPRILVIDDDSDLLRLVTLLLKRIDAETIPAETGTAGLKAATADPRPDLLILDLMLPDMDGFEVLRRIRAQKELDRLPVIILSAKADPVTIRQGMELGADSYVTKPYIANNLIERVRALLIGGRRALP
jgi:DNA-binding response OmpR family regulator